MRVTQSMMVNNMAYWASQQADKLSDAQTAVGSGKKINKPSDDPQAAGQIQSDRVSLSQYSQYESNIAQAKTWVGVSSATLNTAYTILQNARNTVYSSGGTDIETVVTPTEATSSIKPVINLNSDTATGDPPYFATINVYDADLNAIPLTVEFTKIVPTFRLDLSANSLADTNTVTIGGQEYKAVDSYSDIKVNLNGVVATDTVTVGDIGGQVYTAVTSYTDITVDFTAGVTAGDTVTVGGAGGETYIAVNGGAVGAQFDMSGGPAAAATSLAAAIGSVQGLAYGAASGGNSVTITAVGATILDDTSVTASVASFTPTAGEFISTGGAAAAATSLAAAITNVQGIAYDAASGGTDTVTITAVGATILDDNSVAVTGAPSYSPTAGEFIISGTAAATAANLVAAINRHQVLVGSDYVVSRTTAEITIVSGLLSILNATTVVPGTASSESIKISSAIDNPWSWESAIPGTDGTATGGGLLDFDDDGQLVAGTDPTISLALTNGADTPQTITWDLYDSGATNDSLTQYAAQSAISTDTTNIAVGLLTNSYNEVLSLANSLYASSYMYSGDLSATKPFTNEVTVATAGGIPENIIFDLAADAATADIQVTNSAGEVVRHITIPDLLNPAVGAAGTKTISWDGHDDAGIHLSEGQYSYTVTALNGTTSVAAYHTYRGDDLNGEKEVLTGVNERLVLNNNGKDIFSDILNKISQAITAITAIGRIRATLPLDEEALAIEEAKWANSGAELKKSLTELETKQVELANAIVQLGSASTRAQQVTNTTITRISELELGSPEEAAIKLQAQQTNYEQVISVTANVLRMPKLTDYI